MEFAPLIAKPFLPRAESAEVLSRLGHNIAVKLEDDSSRWACTGQVVRFGLYGSSKQVLETALPSFTVRSK